MPDQEQVITPSRKENEDSNLQDFQSALFFHQKGDLLEAKKIYEKILAKNPRHFDSLHLSGVHAFQLGWFDESISFFEKALQINSQFAPLRLNFGSALQKLRRYEDALSSFDKAITIKPDYAEAFYNRGVTLIELERIDEALDSYNKAIAIKPDYVEALNNRGVALQNLKRFHEALENFDQIISFKSNDAEAFYNRALALKELSRMEEALQAYDKAISIRPYYAEAFYNRGVMLKGLDRLDEAFHDYDKAISIKPDYAEAHNNRGVALQELKRFEEALLCFDRAIEIIPDFALAYNNRGNALKELRRFDAALQSYARTVILQSDFAEAFNNHGVTLRELKRFEEALKSYDHAISIRPNYAEAFNNRGVALQDLARFDDALQTYDTALKYKPDYFIAHSNRLFTMGYDESVTEAARFEEARKFGVNVRRHLGDQFTSWNTAESATQLRIGLVSGDFRRHSVGFFLESVLSNLDPTKLAVYAYTNNLHQDDLTLRMKQIFVSYKSLVGLSDRAAASLIHSDGVQILIDLSGHSALNRLPAFALKPAPVQASWLGYCGTTGVKEIDYVIGDRYVTPIQEESHFFEKIKRLPECYFCFTAPDAAIEIENLPALKNGYVTFGCFNNFSKINEAVIELWAKVLHAVDKSMLFLKSGQLASPEVVKNTRGAFESRGIPAERLLFEGPTSLQHYFESYNKIDIALDPFPFPGGATSAQALWMGVPVLTKTGRRFVSHNGETIAHNAGLSDWVAGDEDDYVQKALRFSSDLPALASLRAGLRAQVLASPLFDARRFARNFETALFEIWEDYKKGR